MKVDLYVDVFPGAMDQPLYATSIPSVKSKMCKRYKITVNIPNWAFTDVIDGEAPVEAVCEVDNEQ